jgi:hypothetical protein
MSAEESQVAEAARVQAANRREAARHDRLEAQAQRDIADIARDEADKQRLVSMPSTGLAMAFAEIARYLFEAENFDEVLNRVVQTAVSTVRGCAMASVTVRETGDMYRTMVATGDAALGVDLAQYQVGEGPCLDATDEPLIHAPSLPDPRWPQLGSRPIDAGVHSIVSYRIAAAAEASPFRGSLNAYATAPHAYDDDAVEIGLILAAHASVVVRAMREREAAETLGRYLHQALESRDVISQAKGMLVERLRIKPEEAFDLLRRSSQSLHTKLVHIAQRLTETGAMDDITD